MGNSGPRCVVLLLGSATLSSSLGPIQGRPAVEGSCPCYPRESRVYSPPNLSSDYSSIKGGCKEIHL